MKHHSVGTNYIFNLISSVFNIILPIITTPYISQALGVSNIGIYSYTYSVVSMFLLTGALGSATHGQRAIAIFQDDITKKSKAFFEIFLLRCITISISMLLFVVTVLIYGKYSIYFFLQLPYFLGAVFDITWFYQGNDTFGFLVLRNIFFKLLGFGLILLFVKDSGDLLAYVFIMAASNLLGNLSMWPLLKKSIIRIPIKSISLREHFQATFVYFIPTLAYQLYALIDKVLLGFIGNEVETGYYEQASKIVTLATTVLSSYNIVIRTKMNYVYHQYILSHGKKEKQIVDQTLIDSVNFVLLLACPISAGIFAISSNLTTWFFGSEFGKVATLLKFSCVLVFINSFRGLLGASVFNPMGIQMQKKANLSQWIAAIINVLLTAILIPKFYAYGAVAASILSEAVILIMYLYFARSVLNFQGILKSIVKYLFASVVMIFVIINFDQFSEGMLCTLLQICVGAFVYFAILLLIGDDFLRTILRKLVNKAVRSK